MPNTRAGRNRVLAWFDISGPFWIGEWPFLGWHISCLEKCLLGRFPPQTRAASIGGLFSFVLVTDRYHVVYKGRPASIDAAQVRAMKAQGIGASEIAKALKIGRASVYRVMEAG